MVLTFQVVDENVAIQLNAIEENFTKDVCLLMRSELESGIFSHCPEKILSSTCA